VGEQKTRILTILGLFMATVGLGLPNSRCLPISPTFVHFQIPNSNSPTHAGVWGKKSTSSLFFQFLFSSSYHKFLGNFPISKEIFGRISEDWVHSCFTPNAFNMRIHPVVSNKNILPELVPGGFIKIAVDKQS
jgi:hypothetical protein